MATDLAVSPHPFSKPTRLQYLSAILISLSGVIIIAFQQKLVGYLILICGAAVASRGTARFFREMLVLAGAVALLGATPINTDIRVGHASVMFIAMWTLLLAPYLIFRYGFKNRAIQFKFRHTPRWTKLHLLYFVIVVAIAYLYIPFYLVNSGVYHNWPAAPDLDRLGRLFIGTNMLGLWDELFFVCTVLTIFRRHFSFTWANILMSAIFTSFLFDLGFRSYGPPVIILFTLLQGFIYKQTKSLPFVITIHLTFDLILFFALVHAHQPDRFNFFLT